MKKKLVLKKEVIAQLDNSAMESLLGGKLGELMKTIEVACYAISSPQNPASCYGCVDITASQCGTIYNISNGCGNTGDTCDSGGGNGPVIYDPLPQTAIEG